MYDATPGPGNFVFALRMHRSRNPFSTGGAKTHWVVAYLDPSNYIDVQLDSKFLYRTEVVDGTRHDLPRLPHHIPDNAQSVTFSLEVLPTMLVQRYSMPNGGWTILDSWERGKAPTLSPGKVRNFTDGHFGFFIPVDHELEIANFSYYPKPK